MSNKNPTVAVSILTADFLNLHKELNRIVKAKISAIHFDVMDNHFVPNLSFGPKILSDVCKYLADKNVVVDCHMMVKIDENRDIKDYLKPFIIPGVNSITLHYEALTKQQLNDFINWENTKFLKGLALNPQTNIKNILQFLNNLDLVLLMSVNPGFGNQSFISTTYDKIKELKNEIDFLKINKKIIIAVDGGINQLTAKQCIELGANYLVSGSYLISSSNSIEFQLKQMLNYE